MKKIIVITGSPRKGGNSDLMADAFIKGAGKNGHQITKIAAADLKIKGCRACGGCYSTGNPCIFSDDFNWITPMVLEADVVVFATPLYWYSFSEQIKAIIDRFYALVRSPVQFKGNKECILLAAGAGEESQFEGLTRTYELIAEFLEWTDSGRILAAGASEKGDVEMTGIIKKVEELGQAI